MKIKLTESQLSRIVEDNLHPKQERFLNMFFERVEDLSPKDALEVYFIDFGFDERMFKYSKRIRDWFENTILPGLRGSHIEKHDSRLISMIEIFIDEEISEIVGSDNNPLKKFISLNKLQKSLVDRFGIRGIESKILKEILGGMIDDVVSYLFDSYVPKDAIRILSNLKKNLKYDDIVNLTRIVKDFAEKNGVTLVPKHENLTFQKGEDSMVRDLINYMKEVPQKTKRGFLNYIGSHYTAGQHSGFWSAVNKAGIIQKIGGGNNVTYQLGPNYKSWEEGKLVAF